MELSIIEQFEWWLEYFAHVTYHNAYILLLFSRQTVTGPSKWEMTGYDKSKVGNCPNSMYKFGIFFLFLVFLGIFFKDAELLKKSTRAQ